MTPKLTLTLTVVGSALALGVPAAFGKVQPAVSNYQPGVSSYPDAVERAVFAREASERLSVGNYPDAFERAVLATERSRSEAYLDAHDRGDGLVGSGRTPTAEAIGDAHQRVEPQVPTRDPVSSSGRDIEWPQIGAGFAVGILLALGLGMAMRFTRVRQPAH